MGPVVATGGNRSQVPLPQEPQKHAKTVAVGCDQLPKGWSRRGAVGPVPQIPHPLDPVSSISMKYRI
jgi:hypothetical protein